MRIKLHLALACLLQIACLSTGRADAIDAMRNFINDEVPKLTVSYATAELKKRWFDSFQTGLLETTVVTSEVVRRLNRMTVSASDEELSVEKAVEQLILIDAYLAYLNRAERRLLRLKEAIRNLLEICEVPEAHETAAIRSVGIRTIADVLVPPPSAAGVFLMYYDGNPAWVGKAAYVVTFMYSWFKIAIEADKHRELLELVEAMPTKVISHNEIQQLSINICESERERNKAVLNRAFSLSEDFEVAIKKTRTQMWRAFAAIEGQLLPAAFSEVIEKSGIKAALISDAQRVIKSKLNLDIAVIKNALEKKELVFKTIRSCVDLYAALEDYEDFISEAHVQTQAVLATIDDTQVNQKLTDLSSDIERRTANLASLRAELRKRSC